ncbi:MAG: tetratricopeptide repeat protein [Acidobacteriota bacterium]|nr:tetratricopeptide repeat protein [Acidobacteriota bacterium]
MRNSRLAFASRRAIGFLFFTCLLVIASRASIKAQQSSVSANSADTLQGIDLYRQGHISEAIMLLTRAVKGDENDADAWYYLGLSYKRIGSTCEAIPAFERVRILRPDFVDAYSNLAVMWVHRGNAVGAKAIAQRAIELGDNSAEMQYVIGAANLQEGNAAKALEEAETALKIQPEFARAFLLKSFAHIGLNQYQEAAESLEKFLAASPDDQDAATWRGQIETLRALAQAGEKSDVSSRIFSPKEVATRAHMLSRPEPQYTEEARRACLEGSVILRGVMAEDGKVKNLLVIRALGYGLTTRAVNAARSIKFIPASVDGRPVSQSIQIEYNFNLF